MGLGTLSSTGELNREDILDNHKSSEKQPKDWIGLIDKIHLHKTILSIVGEVAVLSEVEKPKQRDAWVQKKRAVTRRQSSGIHTVREAKKRKE